MKLILSLVLVIFCSGCGVGYPSIGVLWTDFKARLDLKIEKREEALQKYYDIIAQWPAGAEPHSNAGVILSQIEKDDDALKSFQYALQLSEKSQDFKLNFQVLFNLGVYYTKVKNIGLAIDSYQAALEIIPTSNEAKTNIELLIQQQKDQQQKDQDKKSDQDNNENQKNSDSKDQKDEQGKDKKDDKKEDKPDENQDKKDEQKPESSAQYKPRPYKGDQLSEGDVKKILGELRNQEQKIRANFDKKENGKSSRNGKDW